MGLSRIQINTKPESHFPRETNVCLHHSLAKKLGIPNLFLIRFGSSKGIGHLWLNPQKHKTFHLSEKLADQLRLPNQQVMYAHFDLQSRHLRLGPLLGILIDTWPTDQQQQKFGVMSKFLEECAQAGKNYGILVAILLPQTLNTHQKQIEGWTYQKNQWIKTILPLPDVIYNRITSRKIESRKENQEKLNILRTYYKIPIFNETFLNKLEVHHLLAKDPHLHSVLPATVPFHKQHLIKMLKTYPILYLKPTNGSLGKGIVRLVKTPKKIYYQSAKTGGTITLTFRSVAECVKVVAARIGKQPYLIQQGLNLATFTGRQLDFRVLAQKNRLGKWANTSTVARIANDKHIVSNLARGGMIRRAVDVLQEIQLVHKPSLQELKKTALLIAQSFDKLADGHFAELGIDLALDKRGKIWLIELNSKPSKTDDSLIDSTVDTRPSVNRLMNYIHFLTGIHPPRIKQRKGARR